MPWHLETDDGETIGDDSPPELKKTRDLFEKPLHFPSLRIGEDVWVGPGATIKDHITIGHDSLIGAGAVVVSDVEPNQVVIGNPARFLRWNNDP